MSGHNGTQTRTGKRAAAIVGIVALLAFTIGVTLSWQEIQVQYHLYRLRNEPGYLTEVVSAPEKSIQRSAMIEYLETDDGKERLFDVYLETHRQFISILVDISADNRGGIANLKEAFLAIHGNAFVCVYKERVRRGHSFLQSGEASTDDAGKSIQRLLSPLVDDSYTSERYKDLIFSFQDARKGTARIGLFGRSASRKLEELGFPNDTIAVSIKHATDRE